MQFLPFVLFLALCFQLSNASLQDCVFHGYANTFKPCVGQNTCSQWKKYEACRHELGWAGPDLTKYARFRNACAQNHPICPSAGAKAGIPDCATVLAITTDDEPSLCKVNAMPDPCGELTEYSGCLETKKNVTGRKRIPQIANKELYQQQCSEQDPQPCANLTVLFEPANNATMMPHFDLSNLTGAPDNLTTDESSNVNQRIWNPIILYISLLLCAFVI